jgi:hypothetical protein
MKEVTKERTKIEKYMVYQATDGTEFNNPEECRKYEESALGVIGAKIAKLITYDTRNNPQEDAWTLLGGTDDNDVIAIKPKTAADLDAVKQFFALVYSYLFKDDTHKEFIDSRFAIIEEACNNDDVILFGINCEGEFYFINSRQNIINNINKMTDEK